VSSSVPSFLVVAPAGPHGLPEAAAARLDEGTAGTGSSYRPDGRHTPILALDEGGDFLMLMAEHRDCIEHRIALPITVSRT
jgi:hypothetical protein